jgi:hypothetical protein
MGRKPRTETPRFRVGDRVLILPTLRQRWAGQRAAGLPRNRCHQPCLWLCPRWLRFLEEVLEGDKDRISLLQEWFGYCLTHDTSLHAFMVLEGSGANGKSVVCEILTKMLGVDNVSNVPLEVFADRFQLATTLGKLSEYLVYSVAGK